MDTLLDLLLNKQVLFEVHSFLIPLMIFATLVLGSILGTIFGIFLGIIARCLTALGNQEALTFGGTSAARFGGLLLCTILTLGVLPELIALLLLPGLLGSPAAL